MTINNTYGWEMYTYIQVTNTDILLFISVIIHLRERGYIYTNINNVSINNSYFLFGKICQNKYMCTFIFHKN